MQAGRDALPEQDTEARQAVGIRTQGEGAVVLLEDFTDEDQADALAASLGGEEGAEELGFRLLVDAFAGVGYLKAHRVAARADEDLAVVPDRLGCILDNVDQHLLEKGAVEVDNGRYGSQIHVNPDIAALADRLHKALAGEDDGVQRLCLGLRFGNAHDIGKVGDEMAHAVATLYRDAKHFADVFGILHLAKGRFERV